jgi:hypothetical protein
MWDYGRALSYQDKWMCLTRFQFWTGENHTLCLPGTMCPERVIIRVHWKHQVCKSDLTYAIHGLDQKVFALSRQDLLPCALALRLPHSLPLVLSVQKLNTWIIWRYRIVKSHYIFRNLSIAKSLLQTFDTLSDVLPSPIMRQWPKPNDRIWSFIKCDIFWSNILRNELVVPVYSLDSQNLKIKMIDNRSILRE